MGQDQSQPVDSAEAPAHHLEDLKSIEGFQVVRLLPNSPAHHAGLVPYFDIITSLDHYELQQTEEMPVFAQFRRYISEHRDTPVCMTVYNLHIRAFRDVLCTPTDAWGGGGLLGCSIEWARADDCVQRSWHIVEVLEGSPASYCPQISAERDYIVGMQQPEEQLISLLKGEDDFYSRLEMWQALQRSAVERNVRAPQNPVAIPHTLLLLIYDSAANAVKEVLVEMGTRPGAPLGISIASGLLHIIPAADPGDLAHLPVMNQFFVPKDPHRVGEAPHPQQLPQPPAASGGAHASPSDPLPPPPPSQQPAPTPATAGEGAQPSPSPTAATTTAAVAGGGAAAALAPLLPTAPVAGAGAPQLVNPFASGAAPAPAMPPTQTVPPPYAPPSTAPIPPQPSQPQQLQQQPLPGTRPIPAIRNYPHPGRSSGLPQEALGNSVGGSVPPPPPPASYQGGAAPAPMPGASGASFAPSSQPLQPAPGEAFSSYKVPPPLQFPLFTQVMGRSGGAQA